MTGTAVDGDGVATGRAARAGRAITSRPELYAPLAAVLIALSVLFLHLAVQKRSLPAALVHVGVGGVLGGGALLVVGQLIAGFMATPPGLKRGLGLALCSGAAGTAITAVGLWLVWGWLAAAGLVLVMVGLVAFNIWLSRCAVERPRAWVVAGLALSITGPLLIVSGTTGRGLAGFATFVVGLAGFKLGMLPLIDQVAAEDGRPLPRREVERVRRVRARGVVLGGAAFTIVGFVVALSGAAGERTLVVALGWLAVVAALSAAGLAGTRLYGPRPVWALVAIAGAACTWSGVHMVVGVVGDWWTLTIVVCAVVAASGAWFVFRGEGLVFLVLLGFVLAWAFQDRSAGELPRRDPGTPTVLALGDSFISGEGAATFLPGTNTSHGDANTCRRAATSHPALVAATLDPPMRIHTLACSGAKIGEVTTFPQKQNVGSHIAGWLPQLDSLRHTDPVFVDPQDLAAVEVVLVSIGGNDAGFGTIIKSCLLPTDCAEQQQAWFARAESIESELADAYREITAAVPDSAHVVVVPYPNFIQDIDCDRVISGKEVTFVATLIDVLNGTIQRAARTAGVLVADTRGSFDGHQQCDDEPAANLVVLAPEDGSIVDRLNPATWVHNSMHPWELGHELQADVLTPLVRDLRSGEDPGDGVMDLEAAPDPVISDAERSRLIAELPDEADAAWIRGALFATVMDISFPIGALLLGGLLTALGLSRLGLPLVGWLAPDKPEEPEEPGAPEPHGSRLHA